MLPPVCFCASASAASACVITILISAAKRMLAYTSLCGCIAPVCGVSVARPPQIKVWSLPAGRAAKLLLPGALAIAEVSEPCNGLSVASSASWSTAHETRTGSVAADSTASGGELGLRLQFTLLKGALLSGRSKLRDKPRVPVALRDWDVMSDPEPLKLPGLKTALLLLLPSLLSKLESARTHLQVAK